ncbi:MAG: Mov34/MPN/PAD-1 family protein [Thermoanaerobaculia bacterium]
MLVALLSITATASANDLVRDRRAISQSWELLRTAKYGRATTERAAFLVRGADGGLELVPWKYGAETLRATYRGTIPEGTVAIVHTHPNATPYPSRGDAELARRIGLPVYVLTRQVVSFTDGSKTEVVARGDWNRSR